MKILYVKNNSERSKEFQLKTIIYEENNQKFIKKEAITQEAIAHLMRMKENYTKLSNAIIDPRVQLAKMIDESPNSLTFEFIEGESLEKRFHTAVAKSQKEKERVIDEYISLMTTAFKTKTVDFSNIDNKLNQTLFGDLDFSTLNNELCFDNISNIDLIFSNIIYTENTIYLIDYEWTYETALPVNYIIHRTLSMVLQNDKDEKYRFEHSWLYHKMERYFVDHYVMNNGFYFLKHHYMKTNAPIVEHIQAKEAHIQELLSHIDERKTHIHKLENVIKDFNFNIQLRDEQIAFLFKLTHALRIKSRIKQFIPYRLLSLLGYKKEPVPNINNYPLTPKEDGYMQKDDVLYVYQQPTLSESIIEEINLFNHKPLISIIMPVYNVAPKWLDLAIKSIESQWYTNWELCIADDNSTNKATLNYLKNISNPKIKIKFLEKNLNISGASNAALTLSSGEYIALVDNDDEITVDALYEMVKVINERGSDFIYSDEDFISLDEVFINPHFKPDFSPDLLLSHNYITHLTCFKKSLLNEVGNFNSTYDGSQDYDLFLRLSEKTSNIYHIQKVLYHWRMLETSTSANSGAKPEAIQRGKQVLESTLIRRGINADVIHGNINHYYRVKHHIKDEPLISIIIPFKDKPELLDMCINSIVDKSTYTHYEIIGISNNSQEQETFAMMQALEKKDSRIAFYEYNTEFNYADINNHAVSSYANGEHILLLNNDIEVISPDWIESMLEHSQRDHIGCVGAKLYYPDDTVQHAGIIIGLGGYAAHSHRMLPREHPGYFNRLNIIQNLSAVTAACLMIKKRIYDELNGLNHIDFQVAYNDVDFCLRVQEKGYLNLFTPYAELYHHESISRGEETTPEKIQRFQKEKDALHARHQSILENGDPYYNPNLTHEKEDFSLCKQA